MNVIKRIDFDPEFQPFAFGPVLKKRVLRAYDEAKQIVQAARSEAVRIRQRAEAVLQEAQDEKETERVRGFDEGYQEGLEKLTEKIFEVQNAHENFMKEIEPQVVSMVMDIAEKVIGRELEQGAIVDIAKKSIAQSVGKKVLVRIHPSDLPILKERQNEILAALESMQSVNFKEDEAVAPGGCIVETEMGTVDARLETQMKAIKKALGLS